MGRHTEYTSEIADKICERLIEGESLRRICNDDLMPSRATVLRWLNENKDFEAKYTHARVMQADTLAEEIIDISDDGSNDTYVKEDGTEIVNTDHVQRSKLRVETRKWYAAKLAPKKYGDKTAVEHSGEVSLKDLILGSMKAEKKD